MCIGVYILMYAWATKTILFLRVLSVSSITGFHSKKSMVDLTDFPVRTSNAVIRISVSAKDMIV